MKHATEQTVGTRLRNVAGNGLKHMDVSSRRWWIFAVNKEQNPHITHLFHYTDVTCKYAYTVVAWVAF
jgi:outer membrane phospholipase A